MRNTTVKRGIVSVRAEAPAAGVVDELQKAFADFKAAHQQQLDDIKKGLPASNHEERLAHFDAEIRRLQSELDEANIKIAIASIVAHDIDVQDITYKSTLIARIHLDDILV